MVLAVQILTIIVDSLLILFLLGLVVFVLMLIALVATVKKSVKQVTDVHFWVSKLKDLPQIFKRNRDSNRNCN